MGKSKRYRHFIGIDVSKHKLDISVLDGSKFLFHCIITNDDVSIKSFIDNAKANHKLKIPKTVFCFEHTGIYGNHLTDRLFKFKANFVVENALLIKNSLGLVRSKSDKLDSLRIAQYAYRSQDTLRFYCRKRNVIIKLANLFALRQRIVKVKSSLTKPLNETKAFDKIAMSEFLKFSMNTMRATETDLIEIDAALLETVKSDEIITKQINIITSVPGVGFLTAIQIIVSTNEFIDISDAKKFACYAGVAPFINQSGLFKGKSKISHIANKKVKASLHMCAMSCLGIKGEFHDYYHRKLEEGKPKMAVINAIRNKLLLRIFACINDDRRYVKDFMSPVSL